MNNKPCLVSVCMITYGHEDYIKQAIEGVLMQQCDFEIELIIADDCSPDNTHAIVEDFVSEHPKGSCIKYTKHKVNKGMIPNFFWAMSQCRGTYVALCDGDDYWTDPQKLQKQVDFMEGHAEYNMCFHKAYNLNAKGDFSIHPMPDFEFGNSFFFKDLLGTYNFIPTASVLFRNSLSVNFPEWFKKIPFGDLSIYKMVNGDKPIYCIDEVMGVYRIHERGLYSGLREKKAIKNYLHFYRGIYPMLNNEEKQCATDKYKVKLQELARLKFKKSRGLRKLYYLYFSTVYNLPE